MKRALGSVLLAIAACHKPPPAKTEPAANRVTLSEEEWKRKLTPEQYRICRDRGTERSGSGQYLHHVAEGTYHCVACGLPLFSSKTKYESCGWPSFSDALAGAVGAKPDGGAPEAVCARCDSHLGHIFDDGPPPTGKRY